MGVPLAWRPVTSRYSCLLTGCNRRLSCFSSNTPDDFVDEGVLYKDIQPGLVVKFRWFWACPGGNGDDIRCLWALIWHILKIYDG